MLEMHIEYNKLMKKIKHKMYFRFFFFYPYIDIHIYNMCTISSPPLFFAIPVMGRIFINILFEHLRHTWYTGAHT